ncbi:MAG: alpha/beta hydrolase, partial [Actinomycetota bacterium]|nr:alpha/beta hydrolase [Actinomycetota bacterium]
MRRRLSELRRPRPLARAARELANPANRFRPLARNGYSTGLVFWFGWASSGGPGV